MAVPASQLRGGVDYPRTRLELDEFFPDDAACLEYVEGLRWPEGFVCVGCGGLGEVWRASRGRLVCPHCRRQTSVLAGTVFHRTRSPLRLWFLAAWELTSQKYGANALGLQRVLGLGSYKTAWVWLHKLRRAMVRPDRDQLSGVVQVDESYVGGVEAGVRGRETIKKAIVAIAAEVDGRKIGRIRLRWVPDLSAPVLRGFVKDSIAPASTVHTDGWPSYQGLAKLGFRHTVTNLSTSGDPAHVLMSAVHRVASLLKRWVLGTSKEGSPANTSPTIWTSSPFASTDAHPGLAACCSTACLSRLFSVLPRQLRPFTSAPDVGNGPQSPGNHYILGSVDLREHPLTTIPGQV